MASESRMLAEHCTVVDHAAASNRRSVVDRHVRPEQGSDTDRNAGADMQPDRARVGTQAHRRRLRSA